MGGSFPTHPRHWDAVVRSRRHGPAKIAEPTRQWRRAVGELGVSVTDREVAIAQLRPDLRGWDVIFARMEVAARASCAKEPRRVRAPTSAEREVQHEEVRPDLRARDVVLDRMEVAARAGRDTEARQRRSQAQESAVTAVGFFVGLVVVYTLLLLYGAEVPDWISDRGLVALALGFVALWVVVDVVAASVHWLLWTLPQRSRSAELESRDRRTPERSAHRTRSGSRHRRRTARTDSFGRGNRAPRWYSW